MILIWCDQPSMKSRWLMGYLGDGFQWLFNVIGHRSERPLLLSNVHPHFPPRPLFLRFRARGPIRLATPTIGPRLIRFETEMLDSVCSLDLNNHGGGKRAQTRKLPEGKSSQMASIEISLTISACNFPLRPIPLLATLFYLSLSLYFFPPLFFPFSLPAKVIMKAGQVKLLSVTLTAGSLVGRR